MSFSKKYSFSFMKTYNQWKNSIIWVLQKSAFEHELATFLKQNRSRNSGQKSKQSVKKNQGSRELGRSLQVLL